MQFAEVETTPTVDDCHPIINMNNPLIPHEDPFFRVRESRDDRHEWQERQREMKRLAAQPRAFRTIGSRED